MSGITLKNKADSNQSYFKKAVSTLFMTLGYQIIKIDKARIMNKDQAKWTNQDKEFFSFVSQLPGFLDRDAYDLFCKIGKIYEEKNPAILEIGMFCGRSFLALGLAFDKSSSLVGVDPFYEDFKNSPAFEDEGEYLEKASIHHHIFSRKERLDLLQKTLEESNTIRPDLASKFDVREISQDDFFKTKKSSEKFHIVHIDGEHSFQAVYDFMDQAKNTLNPNALIIVDDFLNPGFPGISEAVHTHPTFKKEVFPLIYAFNKGIFMFNPAQGQINNLSKKLADAYHLEKRVVRLLGDDSIMVQ